MINLATSRLAAWTERARVVLVDGSLPLPAEDGFADRVLSTFVFDLLDEAYARTVVDDLRRIPRPMAGSAWPASRPESGYSNGLSREAGPAYGALRRRLWAGVAPSA